MNGRRWWIHSLILVAGFGLLWGIQAPLQANGEQEHSEMRVHYVEIVSSAVDEQRKLLEQVHGVAFGPEVADLGNARVAKRADGTLIGVRAPMSEHEQPIVRTYFEVADIATAVNEAEAAGALIAYPPTKQGETGTWAIYMVDGIQYGLWQR